MLRKTIAHPSLYPYQDPTPKKPIEPVSQSCSAIYRREIACFAFPKKEIPQPPKSMLRLLLPPLSNYLTAVIKSSFKRSVSLIKKLFLR